MQQFLYCSDREATNTSQLVSNLITKITQASIEINGKLHFCQICDGETFFSFAQRVSNVKINIFRISIALHQ